MLPKLDNILHMVILDDFFFYVLHVQIHIFYLRIFDNLKDSITVLDQYFFFFFFELHVTQLHNC